MRPLNGKTAMTRTEKNARRRELDQNPFHRALTRRTANAWRNAHKDELNARRRKTYAANRAREHARQKAWREAHPDAVRASWKKWASRHREYLRERDRLRARDPEAMARKKARRRELMQDPNRRARVRWQKRLSYHANKNRPSGLRWLLRYHWEPRWKKLIDAPFEEIERYRRRCAVRTWTYFVRWAQKRGVYLDPQKNQDRHFTTRTRVEGKRKTRQQARQDKKGYKHT